MIPVFVVTFIAVCIMLRHSDKVCARERRIKTELEDAIIWALRYYDPQTKPFRFFHIVNVTYNGEQIATGKSTDNRAKALVRAYRKWKLNQ